MRSRLPRRALLPRQALLLRRALALAAAGGLTASLAVAAAAPPAAACPAVAITPAAITPAAITPAAITPAAVTPAAGAAAAGGARPVLLITGARLAMLPGPAGRLVPVLLPLAFGSSLASGAMMTMGRSGRTTEVPVAALPFLGRGLDPALFDLAALRRAERDGRLPVRITYQGPVPRLPGVTVTHAAAGIATGFLTTGSAPAFGAALSRQFAADHDRAAYGTDGLFADGVSIALAGGPPPRPSRPRFVLHTITIRGTDLAGRPDNGDSISLISADNTNIVAGGGVFRNGIARMTVPAGHYWGSGLIFAKGKVAFVFPPEFTVPASGRNPRVTMDGRAATSVLSVSTPRPAVIDSESFTQIIRGKAGPPAGFALTVLGVLARQLHLLAAPAHYSPALGSLQTFSQMQLASPRGARQQYAYSLDFPGPLNQVPSQHYTADPAHLATVTENYFQDKPSAGGWATAGGTVPELEGGLADFPNPLRLPGQQIQYFTADPAVFWQSRYVEFGKTLAGGQAGALRSYRPGEQLTEDWGRYPLHPAPEVSLQSQASALPGFSAPPMAARAGDTLSLSPTAFSDSTPGHLGGGLLPDPGATVTEHYQISQDGTRLAAGDASAGIPPVRLSARPSAVRFTLSARRSGPHYVLSPASTTTWQWRSQRDPAATVPAPWACPAAARPATRLTRKCAVQPMMTLAYQVAGLSPAGATAPGRQQVGLSTGHLQLAATPAITTAGLQASFDDGRTWQAAQVTAGSTAGQFTASFTAPAGAFVTLRATASDAAGGSVTETITRAYRTATTARTMAAVQGPPGGGPNAAVRPAADRTGPVLPGLPAGRPGQRGHGGRVRGQPAGPGRGGHPVGVPAAVAGVPGPDGGRVDRLPHPAPRPLPGHLPEAVRAAAVHDGRRLLPPGQPARGDEARAVGGGHRMGPGGHPGRVDDLGGLPALPHPRRRGQGPHPGKPGRHRAHRGPARRAGDLEQLRDHRERLLAPVPQGLPAPWPHGGRLQRGFRVHYRPVPGRPAHRDLGRRHQADPGAQSPGLE